MMFIVPITRGLPIVVVEPRMILAALVVAILVVMILVVPALIAMFLILATVLCLHGDAG